jgi:hypothetical protein
LNKYLTLCFEFLTFVRLFKVLNILRQVQKIPFRSGISAHEFFASYSQMIKKHYAKFLTCSPDFPYCQHYALLICSQNPYLVLKTIYALFRQISPSVRVLVIINTPFQSISQTCHQVFFEIIN